MFLFNRFFPKIFGKNEDLPLDLEGSWSAFKTLTEQVREKTGGYDPNQFCVLEIEHLNNV